MLRIFMLELEAGERVGVRGKRERSKTWGAALDHEPPSPQDQRILIYEP